MHKPHLSFLNTFLCISCLLHVCWGMGCRSKSVSQRTTCGALCSPGPVGSGDVMCGAVLLVSFISIACECVRCMCDYRHLCHGTYVPEVRGQLWGVGSSCQLAEVRSLLFLPLWYPRLADLRASEQFSQDFPFYHGIAGIRDVCLL